MKNEAKQEKRTRTKYPEEYKKEALKLVERVGWGRSSIANTKTFKQPTVL